MVYDPNSDPLMKQIRERAREIAESSLSPERLLDFMLAQQRIDADAARRTEWRRQQELKAQQQVETLRAERAHAQGVGIRRKFFERNPFATEADFARLWPTLRDSAMLKNMDDKPADNAAVEAQARDPRYNV